MKIQVRQRTFLLLLALVLSACNKEYFEMDRLSTQIELEPRLVAPLVYGSLTIRDVAEKFDSAGYTGVREDGVVFVAYRDTLVEAMADTLVDIPDQIFHEFYLDPEIGDDPVFIGGNIGDTAHFYRSNQLAFQLDEGDRIDSVVLKEGLIQLKVTSNFMHTGWVVITSDQIRHPSGESLELTIPITSPDGDFNDSISIDSDRYHLETFEQGDSSVIQIDYHLALINSGNPISPGENCHITTGLYDMDFYGVYGHIGYRDLVSQGGALDIPIFQDVPELKSLKLQDPQINIFTASSIGVAMEVVLDSVTATADDGTSLDLEFYSGHPFLVPGPDMAHMGETWTGEININKETSNFPDLLNLAPSHLSYRVAGGALDEGPDRIHFILDTSRIMLEAEVMVPLDLKVTGLALSDTLEFGGFEDFDTSMIQSATITLGTLNELPLQLGVQLYFMDDQYNILDSVFVDEEVILEASVVDQDGLLVDGSTERHEAEIPAEKLWSWSNTAYLKFVASLITSSGGEPFVKILEEYALEYDVSIEGQFRINTEEL